MLTTSFIAIGVGITFRLFWSRVFMKSKLYYVPPLWVLVVLLGSLVMDPRSGPFILGVFIFDLIYFIIKEDEDLVKKFKNVLNYLLGKGKKVDG